MSKRKKFAEHKEKNKEIPAWSNLGSKKFLLLKKRKFVKKEIRIGIVCLKFCNDQSCILKNFMNSISLYAHFTNGILLN